MSSTAVKGTVKDFFAYLGIALALYASLATLTFLCFNYIDMLMPQADGSYYRTYSLESIRWQISALIVLFPLLIGLSYMVNKDIQREPLKLEVRSRKWLLYSVIFVTGMSGVIDLVFLVYSFLGGDFAKEFLLKSFTVLLIAGTAFAYYHQELRRRGDAADPEERVRGVATPVTARLLGSLATVAVTVALGFGFYTVGSPVRQRQHQEDEQRLQNLSLIGSYVSTYFNAQNKLPENLEQLASKGFDAPDKDPVTGEVYGYRVTSATSYEVCANFKTDRREEEKSFYLRDWNYHPGRNCFSSKVEPPAAK